MSAEMLALIDLRPHVTETWGRFLLPAMTQKRPVDLRKANH